MRIVSFCQLWFSLIVVGEGTRTHGHVKKKEGESMCELGRGWRELEAEREE